MFSHPGTGERAWFSPAFDVIEKILCANVLFTF